jgi:hypothetical protein
MKRRSFIVIEKDCSLLSIVQDNTAFSNDFQNDDETRPPFSDYPISIKSSSQNYRGSAGNNIRNNVLRYSLEYNNNMRYSIGTAG